MVEIKRAKQGMINLSRVKKRTGILDKKIRHPVSKELITIEV